MERDGPDGGSDRENDDQLRWPTIELIDGEYQDWSLTGLFPAARWTEVCEPDFPALRFGHSGELVALRILALRLKAVS